MESHSISILSQNAGRKQPQHYKTYENPPIVHDSVKKDIPEPTLGTSSLYSRLSFFQQDQFGSFLLLDFSVARKKLLNFTPWKSLLCLNSYSVKGWNWIKLFFPLMTSKLQLSKPWMPFELSTLSSPGSKQVGIVRLYWILLEASVLLNDPVTPLHRAISVVALALPWSEKVPCSWKKPAVPIELYLSA